MDSERKEEIVKNMLATLAATRLTNTEEYMRFVNTPHGELSVKYHNTLGRGIRNEYGLWENEWTPRLVNGVDYSPDHPDALSTEIIQEVWLRANEKR